MSVFEQIEKLREEIDEINGKETLSQDDIDRRNLLMNQLSEKEWEIQQNQQHEERVQQSVEAVVNTWDAVEIEGLPLRSLFAGEAQYQLVSIWFKNQIADQADGFSKQIQSEQLESKRLRDELKEQEGIISALKDESYQAKLERDQAIQYRDNAFAQLEEARAEVERLNDQVDDLRKEIAVGARNAYKVTNLQDTKELAAQIRASLIPVTLMEQADMLGKQFRVILAETGEERAVPFLEKGKYRLVDAQEAAEVAERFRQAQVELPASDSSEAVAEPVTFQVEPPQVEFGGVDGILGNGEQETVGGEGTADTNAGPVTREEFEELAQRVARIEKHANLPEAV
ncbi:hypothetical protein [Paenibacillus alkalitolerans]|uniref:hypothetical protein n=1 Tax=Paenibacillus alkalitolerans TaxID=2799335 RepID=UPI0018F2D42B|nr:hypothetical protein [Paenibacillus alkalitolerans]